MPGVDLVEDHGASAAPGPETGEREHDPRELAARCGIAERRRGNPRVGRHQELDRLRSAGAETVGVWLDVHFYRGALHRERAELGPHPALELLRGLGTRLGELRRELRPPLGGRGQPSLELGSQLLRVLQPLDLGSAALRVGQHRLGRAAVLSMQAVESVNRSSSCSSRSGSASIPSA